MGKKHRKKRVPQLKYTRNQNIGWHVSFRDPSTGMPRRHRFGLVSREEAEAAYYEWVASHLRGETVVIKKKHGQRKLDEQLASPPSQKGIKAKVVPGSLIHIASGFMAFEESRARGEDEPRRQGTITHKTCEYRKTYAEEFLKFLNTLHGQGAVGRMKLADLAMHDVEAYNRLLVQAGYSQSQVKKRMHVVKAMIDRANRPEFDKQLLTWNWDSRDVTHGKPATPVTIPTLRQLKFVLRECDARKTAMVWMAIGCGFGQRDLAAVRVGQFDEEGLVGDGTGSFGSIVSYNVGGSDPSQAVAIGDVNGDSGLDLIHASADGVFLSLGNTVSTSSGNRTASVGISALSSFSLTTSSNALSALSDFSQTNQHLAEERGRIGAFQARLAVAISNLSVASENYAAAASRIKDADVAQESASLTRLNILQQASSAVLAQTNQQPALALQLLG